MLQILVLWRLCAWIGKTVEAKGHSKWPFQLMLVLFWIGGEVLGAFIGGVVLAMIQEQDDNVLLAYLLALMGAVGGAVLAFAIANAQADRSQPKYRLPDDSFRDTSATALGRAEAVQGGQAAVQPGPSCRNCGRRLADGATLECPHCHGVVGNPV